MLQRLQKLETGWKLFWVFAILYLCFPSARYYWDGVEYAQLAERAGNWRETLHPHHLFYNLLVLWVTRLLADPAGFLHPGLVAQGWINGLFGACGVMFFYRTTRYCFLDPLAWQIAAIGGTAYTWWLYSADHAPYIPAMLRLVLAFQIMLVALKDPAFEPKKLIMQAISVFLAVMLHQASVFFVPVYLYFLFRQTAGMKDALNWRLGGVLLSVGLIGFHYLLFGFVSLQLENLDHFMGWLTSYGHDSRWWYLTQLPEEMSQRQQLLTYAGTVLKSHVATFVYPDYLYSSLWAAPASLMDLAKKGLLLVILWHGGLATLGGLQHLPLFLRLQPVIISRVLVWWVVPFFMFFLFFQPQMPFYRLFYFVPMLLVLGTGLDRGLAVGSRRFLPQAMPLLIALFIYNGFAGVLPQHDARKNPWLQEARALVEAIPPGTVVVLPGGPDFSVAEATYATRTWELVEYLSGPLSGAPASNAIEVVYRMEPDPADLRSSVEEFLQPAGLPPYERLWLWIGLEDPGSGWGFFRIEDRTFAYKGLESRLQRWDQQLILAPSDRTHEVRGQWFLTWEINPSTQFH